MPQGGRPDLTWYVILRRCPCTLRQSELDRGRFAPDTLCNTYSRKCDPFYKTSLQCIKSGRPSVGGSGQTCCYDPDGELIMTSDSMYGGKPHRYFSYGKASLLHLLDFREVDVSNGTLTYLKVSAIGS